ncbi:hypothetical protein [Georgenia alba]|uniref:LPXTG-motif cell wall anchor domain-containing protein n=1 Tax=Georgenia alba TaxID=2233858 RepID=A0ABW2Q1U0_9MICO
MRRIFTVLGALVVLLSGLVVGASPAAAENAVTASCSGLDIHLEATAPGEVTVEVDGRVVDTAPLEERMEPGTYLYTDPIPFEWTAAHDWSVTLDSEDDTQDWSDSGTTTPCAADEFLEVEASADCHHVGLTASGYPERAQVVMRVDGEVAIDEGLETSSSYVGWGTAGDDYYFNAPDPRDPDSHLGEPDWNAPFEPHDWSVTVDAADDRFDYEASGTTRPCDPPATTDPDTAPQVVVDAQCDSLTVDVTAPEGANSVWVRIDGERVAAVGPSAGTEWSESYELDPTAPHTWEVWAAGQGPDAGQARESGATQPCAAGATELPETGVEITAVAVATVLVVGGGVVTLVWLRRRDVTP